jgi:hypothetical protein
MLVASHPIKQIAARRLAGIDQPASVLLVDWRIRGIRQAGRAALLLR